MKTFKTPPRTLTLSCLLALLPLSGQGAQQDYSQVIKELNIMSNIFAATLELEQENSRDLPVFSRSPNALYLAGQGMVFTFNIRSPLFGHNLNSYWQQFGQQFGQDVAQAAQEVVTRVGSSFPELDLDFDFEQDLSETPPGAGPEAATEQRQALAQQAEQLREMSRSLRETQRQIQNLQREQRGQQGDAQSIEERIDELEQELEAQGQALEAQRQAYEAQREAYQARQEAQQNAHNRELSLQLVSTLCDYGITLRSLPEGEHVSLVLQNFHEDGDQVYVFAQQDLVECSSAEELLDKAVAYSL